MRRSATLRLTAAYALLACAGTATAAEVTLSIVGTNDLHGRLFTDEQGRGGLTVLGGYVDNLRAARAAARSLRDLDAEIRAICDPDEVNVRAFGDQQARIDAFGGLSGIEESRDIPFTPAPQ